MATLLTTNTAKTYEKATTPDGRWTYGYGEYKKNLADYLGLKPAGQLTCKDVTYIDSWLWVPYRIIESAATKVTCTAANLTQKIKSTIQAKVPTIIQAGLALATADKTYVSYETAKKYTFSVYYIFAKPNVGQWPKTRFISFPLIRANRDAAFTIFAKSFRTAQSDLSRDALVKSIKAQGVTSGKAPVAEATTEADTGQSWWPIVAVGAGAFLLWRFLNR